MNYNDNEADNVKYEGDVQKEEKLDTNNERTGFSKKENKTRKWIFLLVVVLLISFAGGMAGSYVGNTYIFGEALYQPPIQSSFTISPNDSITNVSAVAEKNMSSVVGITTIETQQFWFSEQDVPGVGSGVIVHGDGYILTNSHVVADGEAKEITVKFEDGQQAEGVVLWNEPFLDLAVIKVERKGLSVAVLGDSDELRVGELAVAIGNPLGLELERTVTSGVISGLNRSVRIDSNNIIEDLIQTDASINPGNSGGPLINAKGEVIGINTAKMKSAEGLGFSIPINQVKPIVKQIIETGTHETVALGIMGVSLDEYEARLGIELAAESGVVVVEVQQGSAADIAGIIPGDVIISIDENEVSVMSQLKSAIYKYDSGDVAEIKAIRNGQEIILNLKFR